MRQGLASYATARRTLFSTCSFLLAVAIGPFACQAQEAATTETDEQASKTKLASYVAELRDEETKKHSHPLAPVMRLTREAHAEVSKNVEDYTCTLVRRERIKGKLGSYQFLDAKIRHEKKEDDKVVVPFSVYLNFTKPSNVAGREALFVEGRFGDKVYVRRGGTRLANMSTYLKPDSRMALRDNRYPITEIGFQNMLERLINLFENDMQHDECEVNFYANAKVDKRVCTRIEIIHPKEREHFRFQRAMVFFDDENKLPIGYVSYIWPRTKGNKPQLLEEYVYTNIELNPGLDDEDFDRKNPAYGFAHSKEVQRDDSKE